MTDLTHFFNLHRPPNGSYGGGAGQQGLTAQLAAAAAAAAAANQQQNNSSSQFDINEFPSLSKMSLLSQMRTSSRANYVNIAKESTTNNIASSLDSTSNEFNISSEDFPALPGANNAVSTIGSKPMTVGGGSGAKLSPSSLSTSGGGGCSGSGVNSVLFDNDALSIVGASSATNTLITQQQQQTLQQQQQQHDGTTAAIDQCGRDHRSYFSPIGSANHQKSAATASWMNGGVGSVGGNVADHRTHLLSFPQPPMSAADKYSSSFANKSINDDDQVRLNDTTIGQHASNDFFEQSRLFESQQQQQQPGGGTSSSSSFSATVGPSSLMNQTTPNIDTTSTSNEDSTTISTPTTNNISNKKSVQISTDGRVTNIPSCMVSDQFGMIGLLAFLRAAETDPNLASVTFGTDLTALGLNLAAQDKLYPSFAGPWSDRSLRIYEVDYPSPPEYLVSHCVRDKITPLTLKGYHEDTLFFIFYMFSNDMLQILAANELQNREWRFHREEKVWIRRATGPFEETQTYERGTFYIFDPHNWHKMHREF